MAKLNREERGEIANPGLSIRKEPLCDGIVNERERELLFDHADITGTGSNDHRHVAMIPVQNRIRNMTRSNRQ